MLCFLRVSKSNVLLLPVGDKYQRPALLLGLHLYCHSGNHDKHRIFLHCMYIGSPLLLQQSAITSLNRINLLKSTGHVIHQQFNIQQLYALLTLYLFVLYLSENKQRLVPLTA